MSSPRNDKKDATSIDNLLHALDGLTSLLKKDHTLSNAGKILTHLKQLQQTYQSLETHTKEIIDDHLKRNNPELFEALQKKSGSNKQAAAAKVFESGTIIHDSLKKELETISKQHSFAITMQTTAQPTYQHAAEELFFSADTTRVHTNTEDAGNSEYEQALSNTHKQEDPNLYALFSASDPEAGYKQDPYTACVDAFDALRKGQIHKDKIQQGETKPNGFDNRYREMLLKQFNILRLNKHILAGIVLDESSQKKLTEILDTLSKRCDTVPAILKAAGSISTQIDEQLISSLRKSQGVQHTDTPRFKD